ncbi:AAA family ATPase [Kiloniella sp.]|uniref:AAA family ATPase n=1 Tax=Kiloniella sp. TaxID=1938587 RepID=UPI003B02E538
MFETIVFTGLQACGKSSFYQWKFSNTHLRLNLDMLKTRNREKILLEACLKAKQNFVVDNTNPTKEARAKYISAAKEHGFKVIGYYFQSNIQDCLRRNATREGRQRIPDPGIRGTASKMVVPSYSEGYDELYYVVMDEAEGFKVSEWADEV